MATLDRPRPNPNDYQLVEAKNNLSTFFFIPDCPSFGFWNSRTEAESAREVWLQNFRTAKQVDWQKYCESRGYQGVNFR